MSELDTLALAAERLEESDDFDEISRIESGLADVAPALIAVAREARVVSGAHPSLHRALDALDLQVRQTWGRAK